MAEAPELGRAAGTIRGVERLNDRLCSWASILEDNTRDQALGF